MKNWEVKNKFKIQNSKFKIEDLIKYLLENRGIKTKKEVEDFLHPKLEDVTAKNVGIDLKQLKKAIMRIEEAIVKKEQIAVFGDYDVDGIAGSAVLWETLYGLGALVIPYIPHRIDEGYGLSIQGIKNLRSQITQPKAGQPLPENLKLIITVDNGIVANDAVEFANKENIDVIITDHHVPSKKLPKSHAIVHTTKLCGTGVAWLLSQELKTQNAKLKTTAQNSKSNYYSSEQSESRSRFWTSQNDVMDDHLGLVALATVADLVPLTSSNRTLLMYGLQVLKKTKRPGIVALCLEAGIDQKTIGTYEIGHIIAPRLNAAGRIEHAMDALRLICTKDINRAKTFADTLSSTNKERQQLTLESVMHAMTKLKTQNLKLKTTNQNSKLIFLVEESYQQGIIGLVAGRLVEEFYRPAIVIAKGEKHSKASARSIHGFNIIEFIRSASEHLIDAGGHPMAAGFTVETKKIPLLQEALEKLVNTTLTEEMLVRTLRIDCELPFEMIGQELYEELQQLSPFGMGNPEPTFVSKDVIIDDMRLVGKDRKHVKFKLKFLRQPTDSKLKTIEGIGFGLGEKSAEFHVGDAVDIVYTVDENEWNGSKTLQLKVKDIRSMIKNT